MIIVAGLGNPGKKYANTRHNVGFMVIDFFAKKLETKFEDKDEFSLAKTKIEDKDVFLVKPKTFMNLSGRAIKSLLKQDTIKALPNSLIVVHDDLDLPLGKIKIRNNGSSGGHKGVQSIIDMIGTKNFMRVKIGIGKDPLIDGAEYVLTAFSKKEKDIIKEKITVAADAIISIITNGLEKAMSIYNREIA